jgi:hypothetical protein
MNDAAELLAELTRRGIRVEARPANGTLYLEPKELLTTELIEGVRAAKPALLVLLAREAASRGTFQKTATQSAADTQSRSPVNLELIAAPPLQSPVIDAVQVAFNQLHFRPVGIYAGLMCLQWREIKSPQDHPSVSSTSMNPSSRSTWQRLVSGGLPVSARMPRSSQADSSRQR